MAKSPGTDNSLLFYFLWTFVFSWFFWLIGVLATLGLFTLPFPSMVLTVIGAFGPLVAAVGLTQRREGWPAIRRLLAAGFNFRMKPIWWAVTILLPFILGGAAVWANVLQSGYQPDNTLLAQPVMILPTFLFMFFMGGSFQEEYGWRGFALPRLLEKWNPAVASLILGAVWGGWHLPLFFIADTGQFFMPFGVFLLMVIAFSVLFTWVYIKTGGNLFSALLLHTAINTSMSVFPPIEKVMGGNQAALTYLMITNILVASVILVKERALFFPKVAAQARPRSGVTG